jgi:DNA-binding transcriptional MocR family regulator
VRAVASLLGLNVVGVAIDADGLVPEALDAACRQHAPKALYVTPTFHNPTTATVPFDRRTRIAAICRRYGVAIVEDDVFGFLDESTVPVSALAPEISVYLTSMSKSVAGGLRAGFLHAPVAVVRRVLSAVHASAYSGAPMAAELAARLMESGVALQAAAWHRRFAERRCALALERLAGCGATARAGAPQLWLKLPAGCEARGFAAAAEAAGVGVMAGDVFAAARGPVVPAVRIAHVAHADDGAVAAALDKIAALWRAAARGAPLTARQAA